MVTTDCVDDTETNRYRGRSMEYARKEENNTPIKKYFSDVNPMRGGASRGRLEPYFGIAPACARRE